MRSPTDPGVDISALGWILIGVASWLVVASGVGMAIGRAIRMRDNQIGEGVDDPSPETPDIPIQKTGLHDR